MKPDVFIKIQPEMFRMLATGKEVIIEQPDGSKWHFLLEDLSMKKILQIVLDVKRIRFESSTLEEK